MLEASKKVLTLNRAHINIAVLPRQFRVGKTFLPAFKKVFKENLWTCGDG